MRNKPTNKKQHLMAILNINKIHKNSDNIGIISSTVCTIHCMLTPFLFVAKSCSATCCKHTPNWWKAIDILFLIISFIAIYFSSKNSNDKFIRLSFWMSWFFLSFIIVNEHIEFILISQWLIYIPAFTLIFTHFYNRKYCLCNTECNND